ncbi:hypothetical protein SERLA73DRAFT_164044 [Serpula lacrymans var. lacrymans S7.3]|uniref:Adenine DNA glycosylase n=1 Tax=Serpula lacrymans var. lacrymans (strain S7.3) TaxID=936435 RepID=F8QGT4_SERL3|nr:hypothetical protein SERLA73DRAFT_164044 [Serpula lacrymans var. lacrymans S7.3]
MGKRSRLSEDDYSEDSSGSYVPARKKLAKGKVSTTRKFSQKSSKDRETRDKEPSTNTEASHSTSLHVIINPVPLRSALLEWYDKVHELRGMPWRKPYNPSLSREERAQRAYEVWISEIMLQQTQVITVIPYYNKWMQKFPTIRDLAASDIETVNGLWKGLGYYSRAARILSGAQKTSEEFHGLLPDNAKDMEATIPGIGRYSAGAICSIAYNECVPVLDGNVHRLLSRVLALHAPPKSKKTLDILWAGAGVMVKDSKRPGDINQALIELGSTVCKPWCKGYNRFSSVESQEATEDSDIEELCSLCEPLPTSMEEARQVTIYPMKVKRKKAREETDLVNVVEWRADNQGDRWFLLTRRPEGGLLAGLHDFPTLPNVSDEEEVDTPDIILQKWLISPPASGKVATQRPSNNAINGTRDAIRIVDVKPAGDVIHVFSHVKKTYRIQWIVLEGGTDGEPPKLLCDAVPRPEKYKSTAKTDKSTKRKKGRKRAMPESSHENGQDVEGALKAKWILMNDVQDANCLALQREKVGGSGGLSNLIGEVLASDMKDHIEGVRERLALNEIRERYRSLSVIFHPDKQHDEQTKATASKKFLEIQKAYSILSDSFLREVYDILGEEGLKTKWPPALRSRSIDEIRAALRQSRIDRSFERNDELISPRGTVTCGINAMSLFSDKFLPEEDNSSAVKNVLARFRGIGVLSLGVRHSVKQQIGPNTTIGLTGNMSRTGSKAEKGSILGTVQHQFSPRVAFELWTKDQSMIQGSVGLLHPHVLMAKTSYSDDESTYAVQTHFIPSLWFMFPPPTTLTFSRKLFNDSATEGTLSWTMSPQSPEPFNFAAPDDFVSPTERMISDLDNKPGSLSGFGVGALFWTYGLNLAGIETGLKAEWGVRFTELALQLKAGLVFNARGLSYLLTSSWTRQNNAVSVSVALSPSGVVMNLELKYLFQKWVIPIVLATEYNNTAAFCTTILPSTALVLGYHFVLKPRRKAQRTRYFQAARHALKEEKSDLRREIEESTMLLKDTAAKHMQVERSKGGLVILEAIYGPTCPDDEAKDLNIDVTVPVQALVHNSQVYVSGHRTKSGIQGFYDPAPASPKSLRVRYTFRDRMHYAEIPDFIPVALPLQVPDYTLYATLSTQTPHLHKINGYDQS